MLFKRTIIVNLGGTAEVVISDFCPFVGQKSFLFVWLCSGELCSPKSSTLYYYFRKVGVRL